MPGQLEGSQAFNNATISGTLIFEVEQRETDLILHYNQRFAGEAFMAVE